MIKKVILLILVIAVLVTGVVVFLNRDKIELIYTGFFMSADELHKKSEKSRAELMETLRRDYGIDSLENILNPEEEEALKNGDMTVEEVRQRAEKIKADRELKRKEKEKLTKEENCLIAVENAINEIYVLKSEYLVELSAIEGEIISYYNSLMRQEGMTKSKAKLSVADNYTETMLRFQKKCDDAVESVLYELEATLKENDGDIGVISQIRTEYQNVKNEKMNYYMSRYNK